MAETQRTVTKALAAEEDLLFGEGEVQQTRGSGTYLVNKIRGFRPVNTQEELDALDGEQFPKAVLVGVDGLSFYKYDGAAYAPLKIQVAGTQVLGEQQPAIADSVGGDEQTKINTILAMLRTHGVIAT